MHLVQIFILRQLFLVFLGLMKRLNCITNSWSTLCLWSIFLEEFVDFLLRLPNFSLICIHWRCRLFPKAQWRTLAQQIQGFFHDGVISTSLGDKRTLLAHVVHEGRIFQLVVLYKSSFRLWHSVKCGRRLLTPISQG